MQGFGAELEFPPSPSGTLGYPDDVFKCHYPGCNAIYRRKEHLTRHEATKHAQQQEFVCSTCGREFTRSDTLRRHVQKQHKITEPLNRARRACASCHAGKIRCAGGVPCEECVRREIQCSLQSQSQSTARKRRHRSSSSSPSASPNTPKMDHPESRPGEKMREYISRYFEVFHPRWPFIHKGSFNICRETPLLLQAMVVIGMWVSGGQSMQSAAIELHDKLDSAIRDQREKWDASEAEGASSACFWPIATYQAILLHIIFSIVMKADGVVNLDLKASISAADLDLLQSLVGSCQKLGMFCYTNMLNRYDEADMASYVWVGLEEVKRFDIALYKLCMKLSSGLEDRQLLPASGLEFPLPSNDLLWHSTERHEWDAYAKNENTVNLNDDCRAKWISNFADVLQSFCL